MSELTRLRLCALIATVRAAVQAPRDEPPEIACLPVEVRRLVHAVDSMRDHWGEADQAGRDELWTQVHQASDAVWGRLNATRRGDPL